MPWIWVEYSKGVNRVAKYKIMQSHMFELGTLVQRVARKA